MVRGKNLDYTKDNFLEILDINIYIMDFIIILFL